MQWPRGSNNRLIGTNRDRDNAQRLFDSQNNARGGFNLGNTYYYAGSKMQIDWTAQHGCGNAINDCEFIIQYMCDAKLRDGSQEGRIPEDADGNMSFGRQESAEYYKDCKRHSRNKGLYTADQNLGQSATSTRQNAGATRYGYECAEEKDYYPYWRSTPWIDVAVITSQPSRCAAYQEASENVSPRWNCTFQSPVNGLIPITREACETTLDETGVVGNWTLIPAHHKPAPQCQQTLFTRENHLGNAVGGYPLSFNWTIPNDVSENCALRIRYNITTKDFPGWSNPQSVEAGWDVSNNAGYFDQGEDYGLTQAEAKERGYLVEGNPDVDIFGSILGTNAGKVELQLNVNTNQYFRTFQDRSHRFAIRSRVGLFKDDDVIVNIGVRGKRGNIVQTYPATEYDFHPSKVDITSGDYVHFQWTGSNANPNNNDGQGRAGSDRSNVCGLRPITFNQIPTLPTETALKTFGAQAGNYPSLINNDPLQNFLGWDNQTLVKLALLTTVEYGGDMEELDDAGTYFDMPPKQVSRLGIFNYVSTRNNNFSNRSQKGQITVDVSRTTTQNLGANGGVIQAFKASSSSTFNTNHAELRVNEGAFNAAAAMSLTITPLYVLNDYNVDTGDVVSDVVFVSAGLAVSQLPGSAELRIDNNGSPVSDLTISRANDGLVQDPTAAKTTWTDIKTKTTGSIAYATITEPGAYVVRSKINVGIIIGIIIGCIVFISAAVCLILFCKKRADSNAIKLAGVGV